MAVEVGIDIGLLKSEIRKTYASVSDEPERDFIFPTGRPWAEDLGYPTELANIPDRAAESFAGVANLWQLGRLAPVLGIGVGHREATNEYRKPLRCAHVASCRDGGLHRPGLSVGRSWQREQGIRGYGGGRGAGCCS